MGGGGGSLTFHFNCKAKCLQSLKDFMSSYLLSFPSGLLQKHSVGPKCASVMTI